MPAARAARWARKLDTHEVVVVDWATPPDAYGDVYTDTYGAVRWKPIAAIDPDPTTKRHKDYARALKDREVLETTCRAFDAMAKLL
jgi:hypothetical protein